MFEQSRCLIIVIRYLEPISMPIKVSLYFSQISQRSDMETGTSSDIEIISMASTYGDGNGEARMMDFVPVPLTRAVFKTKIREISPDELSQASSQPSPSSDRDEPGVHKPSAVQGVDSAEVLKGEAQADEQQGNNPLETQTLLRVSTCQIQLFEHITCSCDNYHSEGLPKLA